MKTIIKNEFIKKCTGCAACCNTCPVDAIAMIEGHNTFLYPHIDESKCINCGRCEKICIVNNLKKNNIKPKKMYAFRACEDIRMKCSSGGVFPILANQIIENGGYVCGAAFDEDFHLKHILVSDKESLRKLYLSKYVQSNIGAIYKEIEQLLKANKTVLFCGTPCQVAGLKNALNKDYKNLFTIDIVCHGVPSQKLFDLYLKDIANGKSIKNIIFRNKEFGWSCERMWIEFDDGSVYNKSRAEGDPYVTAFLENIDLRDSCENCKFSELPRIGDLTIGDFWGIDKVDSTQQDKFGTSIVLCNSHKGEKLFALLEGKGIIKEYPFNENLPNRLNNAVFSHSKQKDRFFTLLNHHSFLESVSYIKSGRYDIGLVCNYLAINFGGGLTQFALFNVLEDLGYSTLMIERPLDAPEVANSILLNQLYVSNPFPNCSIRYKTKDSMRALNTLCDNFVVGSDVLFRNSLWKKMGKISTLDWVDNTKNKIAYAASYGFDFMEGTKAETSEMAYYMQRFNSFSTREESGIKLFKENFGVSATHVLDPVFLCDVSHFDDFAAKSSIHQEGKYICAYLLDPTPEKINILNFAKEKCNQPYYIFSEYFDNPQLKAFKQNNVSVRFEVLRSEDRLNYIKNCDYFIADSFHGICFALIYNKNFICIANKARGATRFYSLLKMVGLENRIVESFDDVIKNPILFEPIDFSRANDILLKEKCRCLSWLKEAILKSNKTAYDDYDIIMQKNLELTSQINMLRKILHVDYAFETDIYKYIDKLNAEKHNLVISISSKDTPGIPLSATLAEKLKSLGINTNLQGKHWCGYSAIIYKGLVADEKCVYEQSVDVSLYSNGLNIESVSAPLHAGNKSSIRINGVEYSLNRRGLNFVIYDLNKQCVTDQISFDTHVPSFVSTR